MRECMEYRELGVKRCCNAVVVNGVRCCNRSNTVDYENPQFPLVYCSMLGPSLVVQLSIFD